MSLGHDQIIEHALAFHEAGRGAALATVLDTWGSAPRQPGAQLAISSDGALMGSVSGGCVENAVAAEAMEAMQDGKCRILSYGVSDDDAFQVGLACGGEIRVLVEPVGVGEGVAPDFLRRLAARRAAREAVVYAVNIRDFSRTLIGADEDHPLSGAVETVLTTDKSGFEPGGDWFLGAHNPPLRMAIIGAAHIAQALAPMAMLTGFGVSVIDPRESFASEARFPNAALSHDWPDDALKAHGLDARVAVVCLTHDSKLDDPALTLALPSKAFYVGALGSRRTHAKRVARLGEAGLASTEIARLDAPIGLDIGAKSPAEIAVAIMARIVQQLRMGEALRIRAS